MNENLTSRVNRLISGSLNSFVDTLEKMAPEMVMEEAIREVDAAVAEVRVELGRVIAKKHLTHARLIEDDRQYQSLNNKIAIALESKRDDLVEAAIAKQIELEAQKMAVESTLKNCSQQEQELQTYIVLLEERRRGMRDELSCLMFSQHGQGSCQNIQGVAVETRIDNAEETFNRLLEKQAGINRTSLVADRSGAIQLAQLEKLSKQDAIQKRLAQLKARNE